MAETHGTGSGQPRPSTSSPSSVGGNSPGFQNRSQGHGSAGDASRSSDAMGDVANSASEMARSAYDQDRQIARRAGERYPQARSYLERSTRAVRKQITDAPLMAVLVAGAAGLSMAWMMGGRSRSEDQISYRARGRRDYPGQRTGKRLIESDRVEGTAVYDPSGNRIGTIERVMLDKITGRAAYAVMSFGSFLGFGAEEFAVPWGMLDYDTSLEGYRTNLTKEQLRSAPSFSRDQGQDLSDQERERQLHDYYQVTYYWLVR